MSVTIHNLEARSFSKKANNEVLAILPNAKSIKKMHVAGCGYVGYIKDAAGNCIAHLLKSHINEGGHMKLSVK